MVALLASAVGVARADQAVIRRQRAEAPRVKRWSALLLVAVGAWFLVLAVLAEAFAEVLPV